MDQSNRTVNQLNRKLKRLEARVKVLNDRLERSSQVRLLLGVLGFIGLFIAAVLPGRQIEWLSVGLLAVFFLAVKKTRNLRAYAQKLTSLQHFEARQKKRLEGTFESVTPFIPSEPPYDDFGLLGAKSLFSQISECATQESSDQLLKLLTLLPEAPWIEARQKLIQASLPHFALLKRFRLESESLPLGQLNQEMSQLQPKAENRIPLLWVLFITFIWLAFIAVTFLKTINPVWSPWQMPLGLAFIIGNFYWATHGAKNFIEALQVETTLLKLRPLFGRFEKVLNETSLKKEFPQTSQSPLSQSLRVLEWAVSFLSVNSNPIVTLGLNLFTPWNILASAFYSSVAEKIFPRLPNYLAELESFEVLLSQVVFAHYQGESWPSIAPGPTWRAQALRHPLISDQIAVRNDFDFDSPLILLSGSNMSGKSTFLKTLALTQCLANSGMPVTAGSLTLSPFQVRTCLHVSDSLRDGFSYFYSEVRRLKAIFEDLKSGVPTLALVDEILRGTNNQERLQGAEAIAVSFVSPRSRVMISTHDLELTRLSEHHPEIANYHFRDEIREQVLSFPYRIFRGVSPSTNALFILRQEGFHIPG